MHNINMRLVVLALVLGLVAMLLVSCGGGSDTTDRTLSVVDTSAPVDTTVTVHVNLNSFLGVSGYHIILKFDNTKLQLVNNSIAKGSGVPAATTFNPPTVSPVTGNPDITQIDAVASGTTIFTGNDVMVADFKIIAGTKNQITMSTASLFSPTGLIMLVNNKSGYITTTDEP